MTRPLRRPSSGSLYDDKADVIGEVSEMEEVFLPPSPAAAKKTRKREFLLQH